MDMLYESQCSDVVAKLKEGASALAVVDGYTLKFWFTGKIDITNGEVRYSSLHITEDVRDSRKCPTGMIMHFILRVRDGWGKEFNF